MREQGRSLKEPEATPELARELWMISGVAGRVIDRAGRASKKIERASKAVETAPGEPDRGFERQLGGPE